MRDGSGVGGAGLKKGVRGDVLRKRGSRRRAAGANLAENRAAPRRKAVVKVDPGVSPDNIVTLLGQRVKALRAEGGLTLDELARKSGVSRAMLSKVERGEKSPTLSVISRTALGLGVSLSELLGSRPDAAEIAVVRKKQRLVYRDPETGFDRELLSPTHIGNGVELLLHRIPPGASSGELPAYSTPTEKYLVVNEGVLTVTIGGVRQVLAQGDALYFDVKQPYRFDNEGKKNVSYYLVIVRRR